MADNQIVGKRVRIEEMNPYTGRTKWDPLLEGTVVALSLSDGYPALLVQRTDEGHEQHLDIVSLGNDMVRCIVLEEQA